MVRIASANTRLRKQLGTWVLTLIAAAGGIFWILPMLWMLSTALKPNSMTFTYPVRWIPQVVTLENFHTVLVASRSASILRAFINSSVVTVCTVGLVLLACSMAAYVLARWEFPGRNLVFLVIISALVVPGEVTLVPLFVLMFNLDLLNTYAALILPAVASPLGVFLLRQFFLTIPRDLEDAARIDGCSRFQILFRIFLPITKPALSTLAAFTFLGTWNDFLWPLIAITQMDMVTLPVALSLFNSAYGNLEYGTVMAATAISSIPPLVVFVFAQRWIVRGITMSGMKF